MADADSLILEILDGCDVVPVRRGPGTLMEFLEGKIDECPFGLRFMPRGEDKQEAAAE